MATQPTKERLRQALLELMMEKDAEKITVMDIARQANVSRATLYRHYSSVDELLVEMEDDLLEGMRDCSRYYISGKLDATNLNVPNPAFIAITEYIRDHKSFFLAITGPHGDGRFLYRWHNFIREFYSGKLAFEGLTRSNLDIYMEFVLAGNDASIRYWLEKHIDLPAEEIALISQRILYGPFVC